MAAERMQFPWRWNGSTISTDLDVIWGMSAQIRFLSGRTLMKALYYGDNLQVLRDSIATESVDLIYLDPPFNSKATQTYMSDVGG